MTTERIDAHHHVWDLAACDQPWMAGDDMESLRRNFGIDEYIAHLRGNGVASSVVVQTVAHVSETEELLATFVGALGSSDRAAVWGGSAAEIYSLQPLRREAP